MVFLILYLFPKKLPRRRRTYPLQCVRVFTACVCFSCCSYKLGQGYSCYRWAIDVWPIGNTKASVRFNHLPLGFLSPVILLDSKAQQTELEWISYPPNGVSLQNLCATCGCTSYLCMFCFISCFTSLIRHNNI